MIFVPGQPLTIGASATSICGERTLLARTLLRSGELSYRALGGS